MKRALIFGVLGQDGTLLAKHLTALGYEVHGSTRNADGFLSSNLAAMMLTPEPKIHTLGLEVKDTVRELLKILNPDEIYFLAGQSSVGFSFERPSDSIAGSTLALLNVLESIREVSPKSRLYYACSSEIFGNTPEGGATEDTPLNPASPYAVGKAAGHFAVKTYREAYDLHCCSGILFNHESPLRPESFVSQKIVIGARRIANGEADCLYLGNLDVSRDWGWAPEYVEGMWKILQLGDPEDFVLGTGLSHSPREFVGAVFERHGLQTKGIVYSSDEFCRPTDITFSRCNPTKAKELLGWNPTSDLSVIVDRLICGSF